MIADTTFLSDLLDEQAARAGGPATSFAIRHRAQPVLTTVITAGELAVIFGSTAEARAFLQPYRILRLTPEVAFAAATIDRELLATRLGENDNWIAGFCRYYGQSLISRDEAFDRVRGLRRLAY